MLQNEVGLATLESGKWTDTRFLGITVSTAKVFAGEDFNKDSVTAVCVYDNLGTVKMYLKKNEDGTITREFN